MVLFGGVDSAASPRFVAPSPGSRGRVASVEAKLHGESRMIQRSFDDKNDDNKI